ncbi:hypothetical protein DL346_25270 [Paenibacillus montanisoli]|uniref:Uncharacterized protein n=1 Tax=Paenibacillus montanisoli TaxID=2081970 RepID=A0A328TSN2_9BACL|nr:hypothetical protein DL346_25270 [Paenibacillus montanisoli]
MQLSVPCGRHGESRRKHFVKIAEAAIAAIESDIDDGGLPLLEQQRGMQKPLFIEPFRWRKTEIFAHFPAYVFRRIGSQPVEGADPFGDAFPLARFGKQLVQPPGRIGMVLRARRGEMLDKQLGEQSARCRPDSGLMVSVDRTDTLVLTNEPCNLLRHQAASRRQRRVD